MSPNPAGRIIRRRWTVILEVGDDIWEGTNHLLEDNDGDLGGVGEGESSISSVWKVFGNAGARGKNNGEAALLRKHCIDFQAGADPCLQKKTISAPNLVDLLIFAFPHLLEEIHRFTLG